MTEEQAQEMQVRIKKLTLNSVRAALFSIENMHVLEKAVTAGERYQELVAKIRRKEG